MKIGDRVTLQAAGAIITRYEDRACGELIFEKGTVIGFKNRWFFPSYWIVGLDNGTITNVEA